MVFELIPESNYLVTMADGTIKQVNPFTATEVWTVPGRANRPLGSGKRRARPVSRDRIEARCPFCARNYLKTPPERARLVREGDRFIVERGLLADQLFDTVAEFRRVRDLYEIVSLDYWKNNFGYEIPKTIRTWKQSYLSTRKGRAHVLAIARKRLMAAHATHPNLREIPIDRCPSGTDSLFAGGHELVVARRHFVDGARFSDQLASSGTLTPDEHGAYFDFTIETLRDLYALNRYARYVAVFQNWLKPAGAYVDHLLKQLVAIDERGVQSDREIRLVRDNPNIYNEAAVNFAIYRDLFFAENEHAVAFAGFGHRFPTLEIYSKSRNCRPWEHSAEEIRGISDLVHACHAATGATTPCNEEWDYQPPDAVVPMPWRVLIKWRITTPAGFEGGTRIYVNTIDPHSLRDRVLPRLFELRDAGRIAPIRIGPECGGVRNCLKYNPNVCRRDIAEPI